MAKKDSILGKPVDAAGDPAVDPTRNVLDLVEAAVTRLNDLNIQAAEFNEKIRQADTKRVDDLRRDNVGHINENLAEHKQFNKILNDVQLDFMDKLSIERELRLQQKFESLDKAIQKADTANEKRFEGVNEFRAALADQQRTLITRSEYDTAHKSLEVLVGSNIKTLSDIILAQKERIDKIDNLKQGGANLWILIVGIVAIGMSVVTFVLGLFGK